jgi:hypothetical protein
MRFHLVFLLALSVTLSPCLSLCSSSLAQAPDCSWEEGLLAEHGLPNHGAGLLSILRGRIPSAELAQKAQHFVPRLSAAVYPVRDKATADLIKLGPVVRPLLQKQLLERNQSAETTARLRQILDQFPTEEHTPIISATARLIERDRPAESLTALLDFIPYVPNEDARQSLQHAINAVGFDGKKPASLLLEALKDPHAARQAAAAEALVRTLGQAARKDVEPLLKDSDPLVAYQLGMSLIDKHDKTGVPLVIRSLPGLPRDRLDYALEMLLRIAQGDLPEGISRGDTRGDVCSKAWLDWFTKHQQSLDLAAALSSREIGGTVICCTATKVNTRNQIFEIGSDQVTRWDFDGPRYPIDLQILGPNRLLIAEYFDRRVSERDCKGNLLWQVPVVMPIACQRLPNGHTFIATRQLLMVVDRDGKEVFTCFQQNTSITTAQRLANGQIVVVTTGGRCHLLDPRGKELKSFQMGPVYTLGGNVEVLPTGRILAPQYSQNCVAEFDWQGNKLWQAAVNRPIAVSRLANGNTLVTCSLDYRVVEIDPAGQTVWTYQTEGRPFRARRR